MGLPSVGAGLAPALFKGTRKGCPYRLFPHLLDGQGIVAGFLFQPEELVPLPLEASRYVFDRLTVVQQELHHLAGIHHFQGQLGLHKVRRAADAAQIYGFHSCPFPTCVSMTWGGMVFATTYSGNVARRWVSSASGPSLSITSPILIRPSPAAFSLYQPRTAAMNSTTLSSGRNVANRVPTRGCRPHFPPMRTVYPFFTDFHASVGQTLTQSPQYVHRSG